MQVAHPLHKLTSGENAGKKKAAIKWDSKYQHAFDDLKIQCTMAPILAYADFTKPFKLHTDACGTGLGAVLYQTREDGTKAVIAYASRSLNKAESHYPAHKLEHLTLKWAVVKKFHEYLYGSTFNVYTDNNPLTYVLTTAKLDAASHHWVTSLANYNFRLHYMSRKMGSLVQYQVSLSPHSSSKETLLLYLFQMEGQDLPVQDLGLQSIDSSKDLHKGHKFHPDPLLESWQNAVFIPG